jgi:aryl-alcohol dehydrogenase-like predicted oxidoreductase
MTMITTANDQVTRRFSFGAMQWGLNADAAASNALYDACREVGINHFDTANLYCGGESEKLLGILTSRERDDSITSTKAGYDGGAGRKNLLEQFDQSSQRLGMDMVDVLYLHRFDQDTPLAETLETFASLREVGEICFVGLSNFPAWQVMRAIYEARSFDLSMSMMQPMYSLVKRQGEVEILSMCAEMDIKVASYSPLGGDLLTGKYAAGGIGRLSEDDRYANRYGQDYMHHAAMGLTRLGQDLGVHPATLAGKHWSNPIPIIYARSVSQLNPSLAALDFDMDDDIYVQLSKLTPAPPPATDRIEET